jgi:hypothetical protein
MGHEVRRERAVQEAVVEAATMPTLLQLGQPLDGPMVSPAYPLSLVKRGFGMVAVLRLTPIPRFNPGLKLYPMTVARMPWNLTPVASLRGGHASSRHLTV